MKNAALAEVLYSIEKYFYGIGINQDLPGDVEQQAKKHSTRK